MIRSCLLGAVLSVASVSRPAHADLRSDMQALIAARNPYGRLVRLKPRLLERGQRLPLPIPPELLDAANASCTTVSLLGVPGLHFAVRFSQTDPGAPSSAYPETSSAGATEITRCGSSKPYLAAVLIEMRSPRGVLETLISNTPAGVPRLLEILPERDPGAELALGDAGPPPSLPPLDQRWKRLASRAQREGAQSFERSALTAGDEGTGQSPLALAAGCHELTLLAESQPNAPVAVDLDLELVEEASGARLGVDRATDADATLSVCTGGETPAVLRFVGAPPAAVLSLAHARWNLPRGLPDHFGPEPRARLAQVARAQHLSLRNQPVYSSLGVQGLTQLPVEVEPGACYSAILTPLRGEVRSLALAVRAQAAGEVSRSASDSEGTAVSFCAHGARRALLEVEGEGSSLAWFVALWENGRSAVGVEER